MFSDNVTKDLAKTAYQIMSKDIQEEEAVKEELTESTQLDEMQQLAQLIDYLLIEGIAEYIGVFEQEINRELNEEEIVGITNDVMQEIYYLNDEDKAILGEALIVAHKNSLTED
jgi:hypothetical protein